jgi:hypothetical protein
MLISEFLKLVPGPTALVGALIKYTAKGGEGEPVYRVPDGNWIYRIAQDVSEMRKWELIERPAPYQNPAARYCAWCKESLFTGYSVASGLTPGWCPTHGKDAKVLHAPDSAVESVVLINPIPVDEPLLVDQIPSTGKPPRVPKRLSELQREQESEDLKYLRDSLFAALKIPKELMGHVLMEKAAEEAGLFKNMGFESRDEFRRLSGLKP